MKKKLFLALAISIMLVCFFAISVSAANQSYYSYEVVTTDGETVRVYGAQDFDVYQGRAGVYDTLYTEAPLDSEGTYATIDTLTIQKIDFTNTKVVQWDKNKSEYIERDYGSTSKTVYPMGSTTAANFANVKEINFGKANMVNGFCRGWTGLEKVYFPALVEEGGSKDISLKSDMFRGCSALKTIEFAEGVTFSTGGQWVFSGTAIESMDLSIFTGTVIYANTFNGCTQLKTVTIPEGIIRFETNAFYGCTALESVNIPSTVTQLYGNSFKDCTSLSTVEIPADSQLYDIGAEAFRGCSSLESINLVDGIYMIGNDAFRDSGLTYVKLPNGIATHENRFLGYNTFMGCQNLTTIDFTNCPMTSLSVSFANNCDGLRYLSLPEGMTEVSDKAFDGCDNLEAVYMPNSIVTLSISGWNNGAFANCPNLYFVNEPITPVANYADFKMPAKPNVYFMPTSLRSQYDPATQGVPQVSGPFVNCKNLNSFLVFPNGFTNFYTNDNWFKFCGTEDNPINIVCLGDMTDLVINSQQSNRSAYVSYYFMNPNDVDATSINFRNTNTGAQTNNAFVYFCKSNLKYEITGKSATLVLVENTEGETYHVSNPKSNVLTPATCTTPETSLTDCFCGTPMGAKETAPALGHNKDLDAPEMWNYNGNYYANAVYVYHCTVCLENYDSEDVVADSALFVNLGYSTETVGEGETAKGNIVTRTQLNNVAMDNYKAILGEEDKVLYGIFAGISAGQKDPVNADATANGNVVICKFENAYYSKLELRINGIGSVAFDTNLFCGAYMIVNDEVTYLTNGSYGKEAQTIKFSDFQ